MKQNLLIKNSIKTDVDVLNAAKILTYRHEGFESKVYNDTKGIWTIGIGRNVQDKGISLSEAFLLLQNDLQEIYDALIKFPWFKKLDGVRQAILIDMGMMGVSKLLKFKKMILALDAGDYNKAADEMADSKWASDVKTRATELIEGMRKGQI